MEGVLLFICPKFSSKINGETFCPKRSVNKHFIESFLTNIYSVLMNHTISTFQKNFKTQYKVIIIQAKMLTHVNGGGVHMSIFEILDRRQNHRRCISVNNPTYLIPTEK